jgi:hypothetical protein
MHGGMHISRNSQIHSIGLLICSRALSDPAVQSYELRIQQSGYSQILIGNESCRDRTKNTVGARTASLAMQPAQRDAKVAWLSHLGLRLYTEPTRHGHSSQTMAMRT